MGKGGSKTSTVTTVPEEFKPFFTALFGGAGQASQQAVRNQQAVLNQLPPQGTQGGTPADIAAAKADFSQRQAEAFRSSAAGQQLGFGQQQPAAAQPTQFPAPQAAPQQVAQQAPQQVPIGSLATKRPLTKADMFARNFPGMPQGNLAQNFAQQAQPAQTPVTPGAVGLPFPGPFTASPNPAEQGAIAGQLGLAEQFAGLGGPTLNLGQAQASGEFLLPESNPFLQGMIENAIRPQLQAFNQQILPSFSSQAIQSGAFKGSSARDLAQNQLAESVFDSISRNAFDVAAQNFSRERMLQQNAPALLDAGARLQQLSPALLGQAGQGIRGLEQQAIDEQLLRFQEATQAPFRPLFPLASIIQGGNIGNQSVTQLPSQNPVASGILGALGGGALGSSLGFGQGGTLVGGALGGLGGLLG